MSKWNELINRYNPAEDDLCDLLDEAEKIGRADAFSLVENTFCNCNVIMADKAYYEEWAKEHKNE